MVALLSLVGRDDVLKSENNMLGVIYDYTASRILFVFIVGSVFLIMRLWPHIELLHRSGELEILQIACLDAHILHNA